MNKKRLEAIQQQMSIRQLVKQLTRASVSNQTFEDFIPWMCDDQRIIDIEQVQDVVKQLANQYKDSPQKRRLVFQEYYTLTNLASLPRIELENERYRWKYELMRLLVIQTWCLFHINKPEQKDDVINHLMTWVHRYWKLRCEVEGFDQAVQSISNDYLDGEVLLMEEQQEFIEGLLSDLNSYLDIANNLFEIVYCFEDKNPPEKSDTVDEAKAQYKNQWLKRIRHQAAVKVLESMGEDRRALQLERQWLKDLYLM